MNTYSTEDGWRIEHNDDFKGDITFYQKLGETWTEFRTTSEEVLALVKETAKNESILRHAQSDGKTTAILIPRKLIRSFVADRYVRCGLMRMLQTADDETLINLMHMLDLRQPITRLATEPLGAISS